jgi:hypothetical protein
MVARNSCNLSPDSGFWLLEIASVQENVGGKLFSFRLVTRCRAYEMHYLVRSEVGVCSWRESLWYWNIMCLYEMLAISDYLFFKT